MAMDVLSQVLAKSFTKKTAEGMGAVKGKDGFSPTISENENNTANTFKLNITTSTGTVTTPNLMPQNFFNTVEEMVANTDLLEGSIVNTLGYYEAGDGGAATYLVVDENYDGIAINNKFALIYNGAVNLQSLGAKNDGSVAINTLIDTVKTYCKTIELNNGTYAISTDWYRNNLDIKYTGNGRLKFDKYIKSLSNQDLTIMEEGAYIPYLDDDTYSGMHLPSEIIRKNGTWKISSYKRLDDMSIYASTLNNALTMGVIEQIKDTTLPDTFTVCIGDCTMYGYIGSEWKVLSDGVAIDQIALYPANWSSETDTVAIDHTLITKKDGHIEIAMTKELFQNGDTTYLIHYWTNKYVFADNGVEPSDVKAYLCVHELWIKEPEAENILSGTCGMDLRGIDGYDTLEFGVGRAMALTSTKRNVTFNTLNDTNYAKFRREKTIDPTKPKNSNEVTLSDIAKYDYHTNYNKTILIPPKNTSTQKYGLVCTIKVASNTSFSLTIAIRHLLSSYTKSIGGVVEVDFTSSAVKVVRAISNYGLIDGCIFAEYDSDNSVVNVYYNQSSSFGSYGYSLLTFDIMGARLQEDDPINVPSGLSTRDVYKPSNIGSISFWQEGDIPTGAVTLNLSSLPAASDVRAGFFAYDYTNKCPKWFNGTSFVSAEDTFKTEVNTKLGTTDISAIGDGTITGAIATLKSLIDSLSTTN